VDPMIILGESDWELRPTQRLWSFSVDVPDLSCVRSELPVAFGTWRPPTMKLISQLAV
jgi:hypothetical protein